MIILLNGKELILSDNSLEINSANPFLENEEERIDNIFSIQIPITGNEVALNYANNIDAIVGNEFTCEIISSINFFGVAIITEVSNNNNSATIQIGYSKSNFNYLIKDKKLKEFDFGEIACVEKVSFDRTSERLVFYHNIDGVRRYLIPLDFIEGNQNYYYTNYIRFAETTDLKINLLASIGGLPSLPFIYRFYYSKNNGTHIKISETQYNATNKNYAISFNINGTAGDIIRFYFDTEEIIENPYADISLYSLSLNCTIFNKDFVRQANISNDSNYYFPFIRNNDMAKNLPAGSGYDFYNNRMPVLNNIFTADGRFHIAYGTTTYTKLLAPCLRVGFILSSIFAQSGYLLDKENFESIYNKLVVFSGTIIGEYKSTFSNFFIDLPTSFKLSKCFENDALVSDFLKDVFVVTGFFPIFNHEARTIKLVSIADIFKKGTKIDIEAIDDTINYNNDEKGIAVEIATGEDAYLKDNYNNLKDFNLKGNILSLADAPTDAELNDCYFVTSERKYYAYYFGKANEQATTNTLFWKFVSNDYRLEEEQGKENYVEFKSETPIMVGNTTTLEGIANYDNLNIPITSQPIRIDKAYDTYGSKYSNSFLMVRGLKAKSGLGEYLYASADTYFGQTQENGISLRVDADNGIMNRIYKNLLRIYSQGKRHSISGYMKASEIKKLTYENLIEVDNSVNLLLSYSYTLRDNEYMEVELELIKI